MYLGSEIHFLLCVEVFFHLAEDDKSPKRQPRSGKMLVVAGHHNLGQHVPIWQLAEIMTEDVSTKMLILWSYGP